MITGGVLPTLRRQFNDVSRSQVMAGDSTSAKDYLLDSLTSSPLLSPLRFLSLSFLCFFFSLLVCFLGISSLNAGDALLENGDGHMSSSGTLAIFSSSFSF